MNELKTKKHVATEGLVWLVRYSLHHSVLHIVSIHRFSNHCTFDRGLDFTAQSLRHNIDNSSSELSESFRSAYGNTLKPHHSFVIKPIFSAAMSATPYRKDFYAKLGSDPEKVSAALTREVEALEKRVNILKGFQSRKEAQW